MSSEAKTGPVGVAGIANGSSEGRPQSLAIGFGIGLVISLTTVWGTSVRIGRLNVIRAIRDAPEPQKRAHPWRGLVMAGVGLLVGGQTFVTGAIEHEPVLALIGPAVALWSVIPLLQPFITPRTLASTAPGAGIAA